MSPGRIWFPVQDYEYETMINDSPAALLPCATRASYKPGRHIFRVGNPSKAVFFVEAGAVRLMRRGRNGEEIVLHQALAGEFFAEDPVFARQWISLLAHQLRAVRTRVERLSLKSAAERVRHFLLSAASDADGDVRVDGTLKGLARELGLTHETQYRTIATMERSGQIKRRGDKFRLLRM